MSTNNSQKSNYEVVVVGGVHHNTLGVVRSLGQCKEANIIINLIVVDDDAPKTNLVSSSKYVKKKRTSLLKTYDSLIEELLKISSDGKKRVIICCSDASAEIVMGNYDKLSQYFYCPSSEIEIGKLMQKNFQFAIAEECGLLIPDTNKISKGELFEWKKYPCITKPEKSTMGSGKMDIHISMNREELDKAIQNTMSESIFIQELISKKMEYQLIGCSLDAGGLVIIPGFTKILRQPFNTNTGYLEYIPIDELSFDHRCVDLFLKKIGYTGLFSLEFIRDSDDKDYFLEINLRNDGNAFCVFSAGVNLPYIWSYYMRYNRLPVVSTTIKKPIFFMPEFSDIKRGIKQIGLFKWLKQFFSAESHAVINKKDMLPFFVGLTNRIFRKKNRK